MTEMCTEASLFRYHVILFIVTIACAWTIIRYIRDCFANAVTTRIEWNPATGEATIHFSRGEPQVIKAEENG
jgi:hypothetical protein